MEKNRKYCIQAERNTVANNILRSALMMMMALPSAMCAQDIRINIDDAPFTRPLIEDLATEYARHTPGARVLIDNSAEASTIRLDKEAGGESIARFVVLPIANSKSDVLKVKKCVAASMTNWPANCMWSRPMKRNLMLMIMANSSCPVRCIR